MSKHYNATLINVCEKMFNKEGNTRTGKGRGSLFSHKIYQYPEKLTPLRFPLQLSVSNKIFLFGKYHTREILPPHIYCADWFV